MDHVIIVAGGKGMRMGADIPKQFLLLGGKPILMRTIQRFHDYSPTLDIILVLPHDQQDYWRELCETYSFEVKVRIVDGVDMRFQSVNNGLELIGTTEMGGVSVHAGVRLLLSIDFIDRCLTGSYISIM